MVAIRTMFQEQAMKQAAANKASSTAAAGSGDLPPGLVSMSDESGDQEPWEMYRNSFTMAMSRGYLQTVDQLRDSLMASEWELGARPMALTMYVVISLYDFDVCK